MSTTEDERMDDNDTCETCEGERTLICGVCSGSGEGPADGTTCRTCGGGGEVLCEACAVEGVEPEPEDREDNPEDYDLAADAYEREWSTR
jgi:hypothetical protein